MTYVMKAHYQLEKVAERDLSGQIVTAAVMWCGLCGATISGSGGPGNGAICERCGDELKRGSLRGCVIWEEKP